MHAGNDLGKMPQLEGLSKVISQEKRWIGVSPDH